MLSRGVARTAFAALALGACALLGPVATARAAGAGGPSVTRALTQLRDTGAIAPADFAARRAAYTSAVRTVRKLDGRRRVELGGVVTDLQGMAARGQITASRVGPLWLTLERNVQWWTTKGLLGDGARVTFPGSEIVWQEYAGHGIQLQWLATFGRINGLWTGGARYETRLGKALDEVVPLASARADGLAWEYLFPFDGQRPPWVSSLAQGTGLQALARAATVTGRQASVFPVAHAGLGIFKTAPPAGVATAGPGGGTHFLQYSGLPRLRILNGFIQSLVGLYDYTTLTGDPEGAALFAAGDAAGLAEVPTYDTGAWSLYSRGMITRESDLGYHKLLRDFLAGLCTRTQAVQYCSAAQHFTDYLSQPSMLTPIVGSAKAGRSGWIRFRLSKLSRVSVRITRGDDVALSRDLGVIGRGSERVRWRVPKARGDYTVTYTVRDVAGNGGTATGVVSVTGR